MIKATSKSKKLSQWELQAAVLDTNLNRDWDRMSELSSKIIDTKRVSAGLRIEVRVFLEMVEKGIYA